jgi:hypothetical protein
MLVADHLAGRKGKCSKCKDPIVVPLAAEHDRWGLEPELPPSAVTTTKATMPPVEELEPRWRTAVSLGSVAAGGFVLLALGIALGASVAHWQSEVVATASDQAGQSAEAKRPTLEEDARQAREEYDKATQAKVDAEAALGRLNEERLKLEQERLVLDKERARHQQEVREEQQRVERRLLKEAQERLRRVAAAKARLESEIEAARLRKDRESRLALLAFTERFLRADENERVRLDRGMLLANVANNNGSLRGFSPQDQRLIMYVLTLLGKAKLTGFVGQPIAAELKKKLAADFVEGGP